MANKNKLFAQLLLFLFIAVIPSTALSATLNWDPNPEPEVSGYKVYYRSNSPTFPFNGTTLPEGESPIYVEGASNSSLDITLPDDNTVYYFTATAVTGTGIESGFSDIIASKWIPDLISPVDGVIGSASVVFDWGLPPVGTSYVYDLYYGTDPNLNAGSVAAIPPSVSNLYLPVADPTLVAVLLTLALLGLVASAGARSLRPLKVGLSIAFLMFQASCGGSGDSGSPPMSVTPPANGSYTNVITNISATEYQVSNLEPGTQYYWKVVAVDNWGNTFESFTETFVTGN